MHPDRLKTFLYALRKPASKPGQELLDSLIKQGDDLYQLKSDPANNLIYKEQLSKYYRNSLDGIIKILYDLNMHHLTDELRKGFEEILDQLGD